MSIENLTGTILLATTLAVSAIPSSFCITEAALAARRDPPPGHAGYCCKIS